MSLIPIVALGFVLARVLQAQIDARSLADASRSIALIAKIGIQPRLSAHALHYGLSAAAVKSLDSQLNTRSTSSSLVRLKIWNMQDRAIYSDDHSLIGHTYPPSSELRSALAGSPQPARILTPSPHGENASEVGLGQLVEAYVPLRFSSRGPPAGAFEMYFSYSPIAAEVSREKRTIAMLVAIGLALLWAAVYRIVSRASRRLRRQAEENDRLARYDQLTGLPNRTLFLERLARAAHRDGSRAGAPAILVMDLDGFRQINNTLGNQMGDRVLCEVAERLREELGADTLIARLGPDEFGILCPRSEGADGALDTARRVQTSLEAPIALDAVALNLEASIGVAVLDERAGDLDTLLQRADIALSRARGHLSRVEVYSREHDSFDASRLILLGQVRAALERDEFVLHYQPKLSLTLGRITAVEALVRWRHPEHGLLAPLEFIPLIEQTALVRPVTLHVVDCALRDMVAWRRRGIHLHMSVNLSARNLLDPELPSQILERLRRNGVPAQHLTLEVTESATMVDPERAIRVLDALRGSGIGVSIDDFGTGNASIDYLARLPANEIKIDRKFVAAVCDDARADAIVRSTVDFARHLSLRVVAEGVETEAILERITALGCDEAQGYLIARPLTAEQLITHLGAERREAPARRRRRAAGALAGSRSRV
ncbi:MAG TPA: bifunctional diguanylate cyclase/phosphodiesterase [Solirubrobacteraceae bacterium]|nr:bifunctional diguanylate cyclase/phosphodiesterase [Solirubrobacteraceae bacterium]